MIYGRAVVGGYGKFMKLKPRGLNNIYNATVNALFVENAQQAKRMQKLVVEQLFLYHLLETLVYIETMQVMVQIKLLLKLWLDMLQWIRWIWY